MLDAKQEALLQQLLRLLTRDQMLWLSGYLQAQAGGEAAASNAVAAEKAKVDIFYATETGNAKALSLGLMKALKQAGYKVKSTSVNRLNPSDIPTDHPAIFLVSTHGEGDPPEAAVAFFERIAQETDGALEGLSYAMLGLGDKSYDIFCGAATTLDEHLVRLGAKPFREMALFDVDYAEHTPAWIAQTVAKLDEQFGTTQPAIQSVASVTDELVVRSGKGYTRLQPVSGAIKEIVNLNDVGSNKQTYHIEIAYEDDIIYTPGDAAGIILPPDEDGKEVTPRLYSIASAPSVHEGEIHLTVALATYIKEDGTTGYGIASKYLADKTAGDDIEFYISQNQLFNLPAPDQDAIMIGPGTGIAPFRSFVYERSERGDSGRSWVLFGEQYAHCDFLYQAEWQEHLAMETLHRLDLAFSRDQDKKIYVQHRLQQRSDELMDWLENGAALYVCGTKDPMSKDVEQMLTEIIAAKKSFSAEQSADYLADLAEQGRYVKDVY